MSRVTPEFEEGFRELCRVHNVEACFVTFDAVPMAVDQVMLKMFTGGHAKTCQVLDLYIKQKAAGR